LAETWRKPSFSFTETRPLKELEIGAFLIKKIYEFLETTCRNM